MDIYYKTKEEQLKAINEDVKNYIRCINPCEEVNILALSKSIDVILMIGDLTEKEQYAATLNAGYGIVEYINNPTEKIMLECVDYNPFLIRFCKTPSEEIQLHAVNKNWISYYFISNPCESVKEIINNKLDTVKDFKLDNEVYSIINKAKSYSKLNNVDNDAVFLFQSFIYENSPANFVFENMDVEFSGLNEKTLEYKEFAKLDINQILVIALELSKKLSLDIIDAKCLLISLFICDEVTKNILKKYNMLESIYLNYIEIFGGYIF